MTNQKTIRVFLASPSDLAAERALFFELLSTIAPGPNSAFIPTGYEIVPANTGERPQDVINRLIDECDVFILTLHKRWGQSAFDAAAVTSYTEEEFSRGLTRFNKTGKPTIFCFFKNVDIEALADPGPQLIKVLEFRRRLEKSERVLYRTFNSEREFASEVEKHLIAYATSLRHPSTIRAPILLPVPADDAPDESRRKDLAIVESAVIAARTGRIEEAEQLFARLSQTSITIPTGERGRSCRKCLSNLCMNVPFHMEFGRMITGKFVIGQASSVSMMPEFGVKEFCS